MRQIDFRLNNDTIAHSYEFERSEFRVLSKNISMYAHAVVSAFVKANDPNLKCRIRPNRMTTPTLDEVITQDAVREPSMFETLRGERTEIITSLKCPEKSGLVRTPGTVLLGHFTTAAALNSVRQPLFEQSNGLSSPEVLQSMLMTFDQDAANRINDRVIARM